MVQVRNAVSVPVHVLLRFVPTKAWPGPGVTTARLEVSKFRGHFLEERGGADWSYGFRGRSEDAKEEKKMLYGSIAVRRCWTRTSGTPGPAPR